MKPERLELEPPDFHQERADLVAADDETGRHQVVPGTPGAGRPVAPAGWTAVAQVRVPAGRDVPLVGEPGWYVPPGQDHCPRCGDTNYDATTRLCLTCTHPDHPCSAVWWHEVKAGAGATRTEVV